MATQSNMLSTPSPDDDPCGRRLTKAVDPPPSCLSEIQANTNAEPVRDTHTKRATDLVPGDIYGLAHGPWAILLAHSSSKQIPRDPATRTPSTFTVLDRRFLHRLGPHPLRNIYDEVLFQPIVDIIKESGLDWRQFGAYRQGWSDGTDSSVPTLLVWLVPMHKPDGITLETSKRLAHKLDKLLTDHSLSDVHVEVAAPYCSEASPVTPPTSIFHSMSSVYDPILPGSSVGCSEQGNATGTFSGFVRVEMPPIPQMGASTTTIITAGKGSGPNADVFGFTCHHVVSSGRADVFQPLTSMANVTLLSPSQADHQLRVENLRDILRVYDKTVANDKNHKEEAQLVGKKWTHHHQLHMELNMKRRLQARAQLSHVVECWEKNHDLGRVLVSSGIAQPEPGGSVHDWALIQMDRSRMEQDSGDWPPDWVFEDYHNTIETTCRLLDIRELRTFPFLHDVDCISEQDDETLLTASEICDMAKMTCPVYVVLRGRTTAFGIGILHDMCDGVRTRYEQAGLEMEFVSKELTALDIPQKGHPETYSLSLRGDSGAQVRTVDGRLLGVVFCSNFHDPIGRPTTHISVAETLAAQIKEVTGAERVSFVGRNQAIE